MWGIDASGFVVLLGTIGTLVVLEGLLSADNALVLAVMVRHLPKTPRNQQKRALRYGMLGAFFFRLVAVLFASTLLQYWILKVGGGVYLLYIALSNLLRGGGDDEGERHSRFGNGFWGTVIGVELTDIVFSVDSILAAVATAEAMPDELGNIPLFTIAGLRIPVNVKLMVIYIGGVLGIIAMRFVAGYFLILLEKFKGLEKGAYYLVGWIGVKLVGGGMHDAFNPSFPVPAGNWRESLPVWSTRIPLEMNSWVFWAGMGSIIVVSLLVKPKAKGNLVGSSHSLD